MLMILHLSDCRAELGRNASSTTANNIDRVASEVGKKVADSHLGKHTIRPENEMPNDDMGSH